MTGREHCPALPRPMPCGYNKMSKRLSYTCITQPHGKRSVALVVLELVLELVRVRVLVGCFVWGLAVR